MFFCLVTFNNTIYMMPADKYNDWLTFLESETEDNKFPRYVRPVRGFIKVKEAWVNDIHIEDVWVK